RTLRPGHVQPALAAPPEHVVGRDGPFLRTHVFDLALGEARAEGPAEILDAVRLAQHERRARAVAAHDACEQLAIQGPVARVRLAAHALEALLAAGQRLA